ncbi:MAG TPA: GNAT family N-acetyltransferase [Dermatophilaceae bacterium]|nr:GNAT family N-acetyltransferase [Dermatophilaceae bacterium]
MRGRGRCGPPPSGRSGRPGIPPQPLRRHPAATRPEIAALGWDAANTAAFLAAQQEAQAAGWRTAWPSATHHLVLLDGGPVGRLVVAGGEGEVRVVDLTVAPRHRGRGFGTALLEGVLEQAQAARLLVTLHVDVDSPARRLYERLGFTPVEERWPYLLLRRSAD